MTKVLHILNKWCDGGTERFVEGVVAGCSSEEVSHSIASVTTPVETEADCETFGPLHEGGVMASVVPGSRALARLLGERCFDAVHIHTQNSSGFLYARVARVRGVPLRIVHSHNASLGPGGGLPKRAGHTLLRAAFKGSETLRLSCSTEAGRHLFGDAGFSVVPNGVDTARYGLDPEARASTRLRLGAGKGTFVMGCVGSLIAAKNPLRSVSVFAELRRGRPDSLLVFVGDGGLRGRVEAEAERLGVAGSVRFTGFVSDTAPWYSAMDALLMPSLYEGLPIAAVEAQCSGLPVIASDSITHEAAILPSCRWLPLSAPDALWADALTGSQRDLTWASVAAVRAAGFGQETTFEILRRVYEGEEPSYELSML